MASQVSKPNLDRTSTDLKIYDSEMKRKRTFIFRHFEEIFRVYKNHNLEYYLLFHYNKILSKWFSREILVSILKENCPKQFLLNFNKVW